MGETVPPDPVPAVNAASRSSSAPGSKPLWNNVITIAGMFLAIVALLGGDDPAVRRLMGKLLYHVSSRLIFGIEEIVLKTRR